MTHLFALGVKIALVVGVCRNYNRHSLYNLDAITVKSLHLAWIVRHEPHLAYAEILENLRSFAIVAKIRRKSKRDIRLDGIEPLFLLAIGVKLVLKPDSAPFLTHV